MQELSVQLFEQLMMDSVGTQDESGFKGHHLMACRHKVRLLKSALRLYFSPRSSEQSGGLEQVAKEQEHCGNSSPLSA